MARHYAAALQGVGFIHALKRLWSSRFAGIKAIVMIPDEHERITLRVTYNTQMQRHDIHLERDNWQTGERTNLFSGSLTCGENKKPRNLRD